MALLLCVTGSVINRRRLTDGILRINFAIMFLNNAKSLSFNSHYFEYILINCGWLVYLCIDQ